MIDEKIAGSIDVGLSKVGKDEARAIGIALALKGGLDELITSPMRRARETARILAELCLVNDERRRRNLLVDDHLSPWFLGPFEGRPAADTKPLVQALILKRPDVAPSGRNPRSTEEGESFNAFCQRLLTGIQQWERIQQKQPLRRALVTHSRDLQTIRAWLKAGRPADCTVDPDLIREGDGTDLPPVWELKPDSILPVNLKTDADLKNGLYVIRHTTTPYDTPGLPLKLSTLQKRLKEAAA